MNEFIKDLINEHQSCFTLDVSTLPYHDKAILLSHVASIEDYERALSNITFFNALFLENEAYLQDLIDDRLNELFSDHMRSKIIIDQINGEARIV